jgi:hypothetical protein
MGLASYLLGGTLARWHPVWGVALGAYFLTVWDLALDPAMAHPSLALNFWIWRQSGAYFGMPVQNFLGWTATAALFMGLSRKTVGHRGSRGSTSFPPSGVRLEHGVCDRAERRRWRLGADRAGDRGGRRAQGAGVEAEIRHLSPPSATSEREPEWSVAAQCAVRRRVAITGRGERPL